MARYHPLKLSIFSVAASLMLCAVVACASQGVFHSFSFGDWGENQGIEILNYRYGDSDLPSTRPPNWALKSGHIGQSAHIGGPFPVGDSLYVKWRVQATGKVYEDTVDLRNRLPSHMDHQRVTFTIKDSQLYVYVISNQGYAKTAPCPVYDQHSACTEIYPQHWQNF